METLDIAHSPTLYGVSPRPTSAATAGLAGLPYIVNPQGPDGKERAEGDGLRAREAPWSRMQPALRLLSGVRPALGLRPKDADVERAVSCWTNGCYWQTIMIFIMSERRSVRFA